MSESNNNYGHSRGNRRRNIVDVVIDLEKDGFTRTPSKIPNLQRETRPFRRSGKTRIVDVEIDLEKDGFTRTPSKIPGVRKPPAPPAPDEAAPQA